LRASSAAGSYPSRGRSRKKDDRGGRRSGQQEKELQVMEELFPEIRDLDRPETTRDRLLRSIGGGDGEGEGNAPREDPKDGP
jgi:hypothetical protein